MPVPIGVTTSTSSCLPQTLWLFLLQVWWGVVFITQRMFLKITARRLGSRILLWGRERQVCSIETFSETLRPVQLRSSRVFLVHDFCSSRRGHVCKASSANKWPNFSTTNILPYGPTLFFLWASSQRPLQECEPGIVRHGMLGTRYSLWWFY